MCARLELSELLESRPEVLGKFATLGWLGLYIVEDSKDQVVLGTDATVGEDGLDNLGDIVLVLVTELQDDFLVTAAVRSENSFSTAQYCSRDR